ncbi:ABC-F family ATP-binding cassette domain-containing protein [Anthocerotibacter panamensis]|uniref:ABC-F family ATP-binding cassette domain-containing protein n=1 Tax=Anthocerotibacter panamensis TaxID=2857077 RepID=UPI001C407CD8|nr:ABC-F family ATP-binding cassette domain-containing protein [Anthocerotibacter panamensis]
MSIFTLQAVQKHFGTRELLSNANFSLEENDKVGLIGTNGSGKSTLLKILAGLEPVDGGQILVNRGVRMVYLAQDPLLDETRTVLEQVLADRKEEVALLEEYEECSRKLAHAQGEEERILMGRLSALTPLLEASGAWELETRARIILTKLGVAAIHATIATLSGGYRRRVALAAALLSQPDVLLLDEPTNHLDALAVEWLQEYLINFRGALLLITHDRYFLDRVTNRILEIDRGDLFSYSGNYAYYLEKKALAEESALSTQRKHRGLLRRELEWLKRGAKARSTKQKARIQRAETLQTQEFKQSQGKVEISTPSRRLGKKVIEVQNLCKGYDGRTLIHSFSWEFGPEDRIGIIGGNGQGKTTLVDLITGRVTPDAGTVEIGSTVHFGYFDQHSEQLFAALKNDQRVIDYLKEEGEFVKTADGTQISASQMLERFLFAPSQQYSPLHKLSGGEKRRLFLLRVLMGAPNVLILDEPTNDLDVQTLSILEEYLEEFNGCVLIVSHDRYFLDRTVDTIFAFESGGVLKRFTGNYTDYLEDKKAQESARIPEPVACAEKPVAQATPATTTPVTDGKVRKLSNKEKRELTNLEAQIAGMEAEKIQLETSLYATVPEGDFGETRQRYTRLETLSRDLETATERWMELAERDA